MTISDIPADAEGPVTRAGSFEADRRDLPVFAGLVKELGWQGLHIRRPAPPAGTETGAP